MGSKRREEFRNPDDKTSCIVLNHLKTNNRMSVVPEYPAEQEGNFPLGALQNTTFGKLWIYFISPSSIFTIPPLNKEVKKDDQSITMVLARSRMK